LLSEHISAILIMFHKESSPDSILLQMSECVSPPSPYAFVELALGRAKSSRAHLWGEFW
jgi:hypothetical protein